MARQQNQVNKQRIFVLAVLALLVLIVLFLLWWWFGRQFASPEQTLEPPPVENVVILPQKSLVIENPLPRGRSPLTEGELQVRNLARNFTERYGSFSTESNFQNLKDLLPLVTRSLELDFEQTMAAAVREDQYRGVETKALSITVESLTPQSAEVIVGTQRVWTDERLAATVSYQTIELTMVRIGDFWYVDTAEWHTSDL